ncbi:hypothetical protein [Kutzneria sp. NPDC051319]|uniref:hypothetical protein n=1 Tax=Kutzneria sp. NPDC051319 TaxID=3155047 RepID=UPI003438E2A5
MNRRQRWGTVALAVVVAGAMAVPAEAATYAPPLTFGIYPGGYAGGGSTTGKPDDPAKISAALGTLQHGHSPFLLRDYIGCTSAFPDDEMSLLTPGRRLDLVISYTGQSMADWLACLGTEVKRYGPVTDTISVTLEQNIYPDPAGRDALAQGVVAAKQAAEADGFHRLQIGFDEVAASFPDDSGQWQDPFLSFWTDLAGRVGPDFARSVDFVGVDLYPDSGLPGIPDSPDVSAVTDFVHHTLHAVRTQEMPTVGLGRNVAIRVSENGYSTNTPARSAADQAKVLTNEILAVNADRGTENVASYEMFDLRDDVTGSPSAFDNFGLMTDDYTPKPMFWVYSGLTATLGQH